SVIAVIRAIRNIRSEFNVPPGTKIEAMAATGNAPKAGLLENAADYVLGMANLKAFKVVGEDTAAPEQALMAHLGDVEVWVPLEGVIDIEKETARLNKELQGLEQEIARISGKLANEGFVAKAPPEVIEKEKNRLAEAQTKKEGISQRLQMFAK
ncbi:MAG: valine--tRNA ligase, partial [Candidatus Saccharibacteria bacterium]